MRAPPERALLGRIYLEHRDFLRRFLLSPESLGIQTKTAYARLQLAREHLKTLALG
ncbi:hypothetical protein [Polyangium jinanense]|uniref:Uncharacterized protein n=1 Tax=Polyangium jinanense TaxID=2829994 RepID=A0A9X4AXH6_9BACT|nr:hypothetical protein [Polyangium jinanense]MDC3961840.1 hypothetical protein [Polyangium jinanense]MDC3988568.1 hypothetical protein [Polyangium jinanense]